jgi:hypothetical protein
MHQFLHARPGLVHFIRSGLLRGLPFNCPVRRALETEALHCVVFPLKRYSGNVPARLKYDKPLF